MKHITELFLFLKYLVKVTVLARSELLLAVTCHTYMVCSSFSSILIAQPAIIVPALFRNYSSVVAPKLLFSAETSSCLHHHQMSKYISIVCATSFSDCQYTNSGQSKLTEYVKIEFLKNTYTFYSPLLESSTKAAKEVCSPSWFYIKKINKQANKSCAELCLKVSLIFPIRSLCDSFPISRSNFPSLSCST